MRVKMPVKICALIALATLGAGLPARAQYVGYLSVDQVDQQVTRQATDTVGQRGLALAAPGVDGPSLWFSTAYDYLSVRSPAAFGGAGQPSVHTDLSQTLFGAELRRGRLLVGLAGSVAVSRGRQAGYSEEYSFASPGGLYSSVYTSRFDIGPLRIGTEAYSVAPYAAFAVTKHVILTGTVGYTHRDYRLHFGGDTVTSTWELGPGWQALGLPAKQASTYRDPGFGIGRTDGTVFTDVAANAVASIGDTGFTIAGRLGYRYASSWATPFNGPGRGVQTAYLGAQAFYRHGRFTPFARVQWEYSNQTTETVLYYGAKYPRNALYLSAGVEYRVTDRIAAGLTVLTQEANPSITHRQAALNLRYSF